eukprot:jgi/Mesvir1/18485/Mv14330-RA.1
MTETLRRRHVEGSRQQGVDGNARCDTSDGGAAHDSGSDYDDNRYVICPPCPPGTAYSQPTAPYANFLHGAAPVPRNAPNTAADNGRFAEPTKSVETERRGRSWRHKGVLLPLAVIILLVGMLMGAGVVLLERREDPAKLALAEFVKSRHHGVATRQTIAFEELPVAKYETYSTSLCMESTSREQARAQARQTLKTAKFPDALLDDVLESVVPERLSDDMTTQNYVSGTTVDPDDESMAYASATFFYAQYAQGKYSVCFSSAGHAIRLANMIEGYETEEKPFLAGYTECGGMLSSKKCPVWEKKVTRVPRYKTGVLSVHETERMAQWLEAKVASLLAAAERAAGGQVVVQLPGEVVQPLATRKEPLLVLTGGEGEQDWWGSRRVP